MAELEEKLNAILSDPQAMEQILSAARTLSGQEPAGPDGKAEENAPTGGNAEGTGDLLSALGQLDPRWVNLGVRLLGPIPAPLAMLRGRRRFSCLIKSADWQSVRLLYHEALRQQCASRLRLFLDLDPVNML